MDIDQHLKLTKEPGSIYGSPLTYPKKKKKRLKGGRGILRCEFDVNNLHRLLGYLSDSRGWQDHGGPVRRRYRIQRGRTIENHHLDRLALDARARRGWAEASHQVLPPAGRAIVPNPLPGGRVEIVRRELVLVAPVARSGC